MILFGIFIVVSPFFYIFFSDNKIKAFFYISTFFLGTHLLIAFCTQYFGIFTYSTVLGLYTVALCIGIITVFLLKRKISIPRTNVFTLLIFGLIFVQLWSIHYRYTGTVQTVVGTAQVQHNSYSYPMFSDEWVGASLAKYSIENGKLPFINPFNKNKPFVNILFPFHSVLAQFFLLLQLNPVENFAIIPISLGFLICITSYFLLRTYGIGQNSSLLAVLFLPLITQSGNLPGLWFALPFTLSFLLFLIFLAGIHLKDVYLYTISSLLSFIFYPPMLVFLIPVYFYHFLKDKIKLLFVFGVVLLPIILYKDLLSKVFRSNLDGGIISFPFFYIIPSILFPFIVLGLYRLYKNRQYVVLTPMCIGIIYWIFYSFYPHVIIIEYPRIVMITSILLVIFSGFGINLFENFISKKQSKGVIFLIFGIVTFYYPIGNYWKELNVTPFHKTITAPMIPNAPVTRHVTSEDISLFSGIEHKRFIAPPWKGLVLGSLTNNDPLESKASTVTTKILPYNIFMNADCKEKLVYIKKYNISYIYSAFLDCAYLKTIGHSSEKLTLYKIEIN